MDPGNQSQFLMLMHECSYPLRHLNSSYEKPSSTNISRCLYSQLGFSPSTTFSNKGIGNLQLYFKTLFLRISYTQTIKYDHTTPMFLSNFHHVPTHLSTSCLFFDNQLGPVSTAHMCVDVGHPLEHRKLTSGHSLQKNHSPSGFVCQLETS